MALEGSDVDWLNHLATERGVRVCCICLVWNLDTKLVATLKTVPGCGLLQVRVGRSLPPAC